MDRYIGRFGFLVLFRFFTNLHKETGDCPILTKYTTLSTLGKAAKNYILKPVIISFAWEHCGGEVGGGAGYS